MTVAEEEDPGPRVETTPGGASLGAAYPNPSDGSATVPLVLARAVAVRVVVYDVRGREVAVLADRRFPSGEHALRFDTSALVAGTYSVRLTADGSTATRSFVVVR